MRLIIFALGLSKPGTMGGNSKIVIEIARCLARELDVHFVTFADKLETLVNSVPNVDHIHVHTIPSCAFDDKYHPVRCIVHVLPYVKKIFSALAVSKNDIVLGCSDFHNDVVPLFLLQRTFKFCWLPSVFLFVPGLFQNIRNRYQFPMFKYVIYYVYQRVLFLFMKARAWGFVITNDCDKALFPKRFKDRIFAFYGGVNVEQIAKDSFQKTRDVVFCSRLHPQKGIAAFLNIWASIYRKCPSARLTVIGNGDQTYESYLKEKAVHLGVSESIEWLGYVNNEAKFRIYKSARIFVHPTIYDNNGMVAAEALCAGLPVIMYDLASLRDVYTIGCLKIPERNQCVFATQLVRLLNDENSRRLLAPTAIQIEELREQWNWEARVHAFVTFIYRMKGLSNG